MNYLDTSKHVDSFNQRVTKICHKVNQRFRLSVHVDLISEQKPETYGVWYSYYTKKSLDDAATGTRHLINQLTKYHLIGPIRVGYRPDWKQLDDVISKIEDRINKY